MARHDAEGRVGRALVDIEAAPYCHHHREQEERKRDAQRGKNAAPLVTECILGDELYKGHIDVLIGFAGPDPHFRG